MYSCNSMFNENSNHFKLVYNLLHKLGTWCSFISKNQIKTNSFLNSPPILELARLLRRSFNVLSI